MYAVLRVLRLCKDINQKRSSIATLALERASTLMASLVIIISIAINAGVYMAIGGFLWWMRHLYK